MNRYRHCITWVLTAALAIGLTGCSGAQSLPVVSPNPTVRITSSAGHELLTATSLNQNQAAQLTAEVKQAAGDPIKAAALISELGGAGLLRAVVLGSTVKDAGLADAIREVFHAGQPALGKDGAGRIASELTDGLRVEDATQKANHVLALSFLLRDSTLNPELLIGLAPDLVEIDQQVLSEKKFWSNQFKTWADVTGSASPSVKNLFGRQNWDQVSDVLASYLNALSRDGVTALAVLTDTPHGTTKPESYSYLSETALARQHYLLEQRSWAPDHFATITKVLDAATTDPETANSELAAGLVASTFEMFGDRNRGKTFDGDPLTFSDPIDRFTPDSLDAAATQHLIHILTTYLPAIEYQLQPWVLLDVDTQAGHALFLLRGYVEARIAPAIQEYDVKVMLRAIAGTPEGINALLTIFDTYYTDLIKNPAKYRLKKDNTPENSVDVIATRDAQTSGLLYQTIAAIAISRGATTGQLRDYFTAIADGQTPAIPAYDQPTKTPILAPEKLTFNNRPDIEISLLADTATRLTTTRLAQLATISPDIDPKNTNKYAKSLLTSFNEDY